MYTFCMDHCLQRMEARLVQRLMNTVWSSPFSLRPRPFGENKKSSTALGTLSFVLVIFNSHNLLLNKK